MINTHQEKILIKKQLFTLFRSKKFSLILRISVSSFLIILILSKVNIKEIFDKIDSIRWIPVIYFFVIAHADRILMGLKWRFLANSSGLNITFYETIASTYMGSFAGHFLPSGIGNDIARIYLFKQRNLPMIKIVSSIFIERALGFFALMITGLFGYTLASLIGLNTTFGLNWKYMLLFILLLIIFLLSIYGPFRRIIAINNSVNNKSEIKKKIYRFIDAYQQYANKKSTLVIFLLLSIFEVTLMCLFPFLGSLALNVHINFIQFLIIYPIILLLVKIPITVNGIGVHEGLLVFYFTTIGHSIESAVLLGLLMRLMGIIIVIPGGIFYLNWKGKLDNDLIGMSK
jgi:glycosyltransferase 2 family protein